MYPSQGTINGLDLGTINNYYFAVWYMFVNPSELFMLEAELSPLLLLFLLSSTLLLCHIYRIINITITTITIIIIIQ